MKKPIITLLYLSILVLSGCKGESSSSSSLSPSYSIGLPEVNIDPSWPIEPVEDITTLDFYAINDFHGTVEYNAASNEPGIARLATYFKDQRELNPTGTVLLAAGDMWQGSADSNLTHGQLVTDTLNEIGFDAMSIGNHEFDWYSEVIQDNLNEANFPFLSSNIFDKNTALRPSFVLPYTMIQRGGVRIGIIGTIGASLESSVLGSAVEDYDFVPYGEIVSQSATYLREMGAKAVVLLNHSGDVESTALSAVDAVFNGHTHEFDSAMQSGKPIVQGGSNGKAVSHIQLQYDAPNDSLTLLDHGFQNSIEDLGLEPDTAVSAIYDDYLVNTINVIKNEVVGTADGNFTVARLGNLAVTEMLSYGQEYGAQVAFHNTGGVRSSIPSGEVTYGDIYKAFPFDNTLYVVSMTGVELKWWLSQGLYASGASSLTWTLSSGEAIRDGNIYKVITINYLTEKNLSASDQYPHDPTSLINTGAFVRDLLKARFIASGTLQAYLYG